MHVTAMQNCQEFFDCYAKAFAGPAKIVEIGSQDVNGSLRSAAPKNFEYLGVDFVAGKGVDLVLQDPYVLPLSSESADIVLSSSCFEHSEMFWLVFLEIMRILKPHGLFYLNAPSNGSFHRYPVDCWRFYPDSGRALVAWARRNGMKSVMLESFVSAQADDIWNDFVAVFLKDESHKARYTSRIVDSKEDFMNGAVLGLDGFLKYNVLPEDRRKLEAVVQIVRGDIKVI